MLDAIKWLDVFKFCKWLKLLGHVMVLLVVGIIGVSFYTIVFECYGPYIVQGPAGRAAGSLLAVVVFTFLITMSLWSYFAAALTCPGTVPAGWHPFHDDATAQAEADRLRLAPDHSHNRDTWNQRDPRRPRFCKRCQAWKPERAHHCSTSGRCVLKMDHYCIWVVNCVGLMNYKFFLLFLFYTFWAATLAMFLLIPFVIQFFSDLDSEMSPLAFLSLVIDAAFSLSLAGFLIMHQQMLAENMTTIEMYEKEKVVPWPYNKGGKRNWEEVFGRTTLGGFLPRHTPEEKRILKDLYLKTSLLNSAASYSHV